ncbi:hypothetical protein [Halostella litorea]|uniref:hypothetical protein n=1 Tax=Halostella litorea TaxID=2528831 RepID=UPI001092F873|nr:hypothetical protein [Halostella litorea]
MTRHTRHPDSDGSTARRIGLLALVVAVLASSLAVPAAAAGPTPDSTQTDFADQPVQQPFDPNETTTAPPQEGNETDGNSTTTNGTDPNGTDGNGTAGPVTDASQVRITPDVPDEDYVSVTVAENDAVFNTSGGFATFTLSRPVEAARITQQQADANVLAGGRVVRVAYTDDAARRNSTSLYQLDLYFADGSNKTVDLYATNTALSASTAIDPDWKPFIDWASSQADSADYNTSVSGVLSWAKDTKNRAELFSGLWTDQIENYVSLKLAQLLNAFQWVELVAILTIVTMYWSRKHGWILKFQQLSMPIAKLQREAARQDYERSRKAAAQHKLAEVEEIGTNAARYWRSEMGVETVDDMVELACKGIVAKDENGDVLYDEEGDIVYAHHGVEDLLQVDPVTQRTLREQTWLKPILVDPRLNAATALSNIERALRVAEKEYKRGNEVRQTRMQVEELIEELTSSRGYDSQPSSVPTGDSLGNGTGTGTGVGSPSGGD